MGDYTAAREKDKYPSIVALQATEREIVIKMREYKQAVGEYLTLVGADDMSDDKRCPLTNPFPFYGEGENGLAGPATACCSSGDLKTTGRWPKQHASLEGPGPAEEPSQHVGFDVSPGSNDIYHESGTANACKQRCSRMPGCKAVVFLADKCYYKSVAGPLVKEAGSTSYVMKDPRQCGGSGGGTHRSEAKLFSGTNIVSGDVLETIMNKDPVECNLACTNNPKCVAFSIDVSANTCVLKEEAGPMVSAKQRNPLIDDGKDPGTWGGTCQGMVDRFGYAGPSNPGCAPKAAIDWFNAHGCKICMASCKDVPCGGCATGCWGGDSASVHYGGCSSRNQCYCNYDGNNTPGECSYVICGKEGRMVSAPDGEIAWVDHGGTKHVYSQEAWASKSSSCSLIAGRDGIHKISQGEWNAIPTGSPMANRQECNDGERKFVRPHPDANLAACGKPLPTVVAELDRLAQSSNETNWYSVCSNLANKFGMSGDHMGCAKDPDDAQAKKARSIWNAWGCAGHGVSPQSPLKYSGCDSRRHLDNVDSYVLTSPKPCFDAKGQLEGDLDWCQGDSKDPGCASPPCQPTGSLCPKTHPYPFTKDGVEDAGCCSVPEMVHSKDGKHRHRGIGELPILQDPLAIGPDGAPIPDNDDSVTGGDMLRKWDPKTGEYKERDYKRKPARKPPAPLPSTYVPPSLGPPVPTATQQTPLFEAFGVMGQGHCQGESVDCPDPPCRSGENIIERQRAWNKVEKLNSELLNLVKKAEGQKERLFRKGTENVSETRDNTHKLRMLQEELRKEHQKVLKARRELDRINTETGADGNLEVNMEWWRLVGYGLIVAIVLGVAIHVVVAGTAGTAEVIAGVAGTLLLVFYTWQWVVENWPRLRAQGKAELGFL